MCLGITAMASIVAQCRILEHVGHCRVSGMAEFAWPTFLRLLAQALRSEAQHGDDFLGEKGFVYSNEICLDKFSVRSHIRRLSGCCCRAWVRRVLRSDRLRMDAPRPCQLTGSSSQSWDLMLKPAVCPENATKCSALNKINGKK